MVGFWNDVAKGLARSVGSSSGAGDSGSLDNCPYCGQTLSGWECWSCGVDFVMEDGQLVERSLSRRADEDPGLGNCSACGSSLQGGTSFLPYEDGKTEYAYVSCASCGAENVFDGLGGE